MDNLKSNTIVFLLKFVQYNFKYIKDFKEGDLYFTPLRQFIDLENLHGNQKTGDRYEGTIHQDIDNLPKNIIILLIVTKKEQHILPSGISL